MYRYTYLPTYLRIIYNAVIDKHKIMCMSLILVSGRYLGSYRKCSSRQHQRFNLWVAPITFQEDWDVIPTYQIHVEKQWGLCFGPCLSKKFCLIFLFLYQFLYISIVLPCLRSKGSRLISVWVFFHRFLVVILLCHTSCQGLVGFNSVRERVNKPQACVNLLSNHVQCIYRVPKLNQLKTRCRQVPSTQQIATHYRFIHLLQICTEPPWGLTSRICIICNRGSCPKNTQVGILQILTFPSMLWFVRVLQFSLA